MALNCLTSKREGGMTNSMRMVVSRTCLLFVRGVTFCSTNPFHPSRYLSLVSRWFTALQIFLSRDGSKIA